MLISPTMCDTRRTLSTTSPMVAPACTTRRPPASTCATESSISALISLAAVAERWASERTSDATTAKPLPCSPARAASTAALSARILVWNAMPSITPMMSTMRREASLMPCMVLTTCCTTSPLRAATPEASEASWLACCAFSAFCRTVEVSSSIAAAVSSSEPACCSVRAERSRLPPAISAEAVAMVSAPPRTSATMRVRLPFIWRKASSNWPISSRAPARISLHRLPSATCCATSTAWRTGRVMDRVVHQAKPPPSNTASAAMASMIRVLPWYWSAASWPLRSIIMVPTEI